MVSRKEPYPELNNIQAASAVMFKGLKLTPPDNTPPKMAQLMQSCFETEPKNRPSFKQIMAVLGEIEGEVKANPFY